MSPSHVLVTGGASGIGAATARRLAAGGTRVSVLDRSAPDGADWWERLDEACRGVWVVADVSDASALEAAAAQACADGVTGLVTCAGISVKESFLDSDIAAWQDTLAINVVGTAIAARTVARSLVASGSGGAIVTVASTAGRGSVDRLGAHYHASKGAVIALTSALASELGRHGIRVNAVAPGVVRTPMTAQVRSATGEEELAGRVPLHRLADPEDVANAVAFLLSDAAADLTGHVLPVEGGQLSVVRRPPSGFPGRAPRAASA